MTKTDDMTYKPGDKIFINRNIEGKEASYIIADILSRGPCLVNIETGLQASAPIICRDKHHITDEEMNNTHGIGSFKWVLLDHNFAV